MLNHPMTVVLMDTMIQLLRFRNNSTFLRCLLTYLLIFSLSPSFGLTDSSRSVVELREEGHSSLYPEILWFV